MSVHYRHFCDDCGHSHAYATDECAKCGGADITNASAYTQVECDDAVDDARLQEIRSAPVDLARATTLLAEADEVRRANAEAMLDQIVELARTAGAAYEPPNYNFKVRQAS